MKIVKRIFWIVPVAALMIWVVFSAFSEARKPSIVFLITEDTNNYKATTTIPKFAELLEKEHGYETTVLLGSGGHGDYKYPSVDAVTNADVLVVFARRIALPHNQMKAIKDFISKGKPVIGIRTAHHAFQVLNEKIAEGHEDWPAFAADVLGCENKGYGSDSAGYDVSVSPDAVSNPILKNLPVNNWHSNGSIYHVNLLDKNATVLLHGEVEGKTEPVAWTRTTGKSKVFYTSLGYNTDFDKAQFRTLLVNGINWVLQTDK